MSDRERWILYPLVAFALALAARTQLDVLALKQVVRVERGADGERGTHVKLVCQELLVQSPHGRPLAQLREGEQGTGALVVYNAQAKPGTALGVENQMGFLDTFDAAGRKLVMLREADGGGAVLAVRPDDRRAMLLGHSQQTKVSGLFAVEIGEQSSRIVPRVGWVEVATKPPAGG